MRLAGRHATMDKHTQQQRQSATSSLTLEGRAVVDQLAERHHFSKEAVIVVLAALDRGGGRQAQFNHPELGGLGQWSRGGMVMIGDMFNHSLKARVAGLADEAAKAMSRSRVFNSDQSSNKADWPDDLGTPAATGSQNDTRYAFFPDQRRLAVVAGGVMALYDTGDHQILGFAQQQGGNAAIHFASQKGALSLDALPRIEADSAPAEAPATDEATPVSTRAGRSPSEETILAKIEGIARLHAKGVLSDAEFSAKKAELLDRL